MTIVAMVLGLVSFASPARPDSCVQFLDPPHGGDARTCAKDDQGCKAHLDECLQAIKAQVVSLPKTAVTEDQSEVNRALDRMREDFETIRKWASGGERAMSRPDGRARTTDLDQLKKAAALAALRADTWSVLRRALRDRGLFEPIFAELVTGGSSVSVGSETDNLKPEQADKSAYIVFESRHQHFAGRFDGSIAGRFGFQPLLAMFETAPSARKTAKVKASPLPAFQSGFIWDLGAKLNLNTGLGGEGSAFYRGGQGRLLGPGLIAGGETNAPSVVVPIGKDDGPTRWAQEAGLRWILFTSGDENERAHDRRILDPLFEVSAGWRWDQRFRSATARAADDPDPRNRYFFRFFVNLKVPGGPALTGQPVAVGLGVEHEGSLRGGDASLPSGTRIILRGDLNVIKMLMGGGQ
jgi:hypothetical protein